MTQSQIIFILVSFLLIALTKVLDEEIGIDTKPISLYRLTSVQDVVFIEDDEKLAIGYFGLQLCLNNLCVRHELELLLSVEEPRVLKNAEHRVWPDIEASEKVFRALGKDENVDSCSLQNLFRQVAARHKWTFCAPFTFFLIDVCEKVEEENN
jgi:hypothetical protein